MALNEDKKPVPAAEDKKPVPPAQQSTPVALVRFDRPLQLPGRQSEQQLKSETLNNGRAWAVEYLPVMRHFRITYIDRDRKETKVGYVHETRALSWEPVQ